MTVWHCIVSDDDGHSYIIESTRRPEWELFMSTKECQLGTIPAWARPIDSPQFIEFTGYRAP